MKKKIILWIMTALMAGALCGCGYSREVDGKPADETLPGGVSQISGGGSDPVAPVTTVVYEPFDESRLSNEYLVGMDYFTGDFLELAPTVIVNVRYDGRIEVDFDHRLSNGEIFTETVFFDLSDEQFRNITDVVDLKRLYDLDPEESDPETTCDGGYSCLIIYDRDGGVYKNCGGFCPMNKEFNNMSYVIYTNLPEEFKEYCKHYKLAWQREDDFDPYDHSEEFKTKYGVFLDYDGDLSELDKYNYIVIDARYHSREEIVDFTYGYQKYVYSYINIGSIEDFRDYYDRFSDLTLGDYENWEGEKWVDVSDPRWQDFILNELAPELLEKGINGFFGLNARFLRADMVFEFVFTVFDNIIYISPVEGPA